MSLSAEHGAWTIPPETKRYLNYCLRLNQLCFCHHVGTFHANTRLRLLGTDPERRTRNFNDGTTSQLELRKGDLVHQKENEISQIFFSTEFPKEGFINVLHKSYIKGIKILKNLEHSVTFWQCSTWNEWTSFLGACACISRLDRHIPVASYAAVVRLRTG